MLMSVVAWGLKLETELNVVRDRQIEILNRIDLGILPRADERLRNLEKRLDHIEGEHDFILRELKE
jgi:hypothetical protein